MMNCSQAARAFTLSLSWVVLSFPWQGGSIAASPDLKPDAGLTTLLRIPSDVQISDGVSTNPEQTGWASVTSGCSTRVLPLRQAIWINEIHYDNTAADQGEFVEVAGVAGLNLSGWRLVLYNGETGTSYDTIHLSGSIPAESSGFGALAFDAPGLQNGSVASYLQGDGIALVHDPWDDVVEFVSYEGAFQAVDGPAAGLIASDLGVAETEFTPTGNSLQRTAAWEAGEWTGPAPSSRGSLNAGQRFIPGGAVVLSYSDRLQPLACGTAAQITRTWMTQDSCGGNVRLAQSIQVGGVAGPEFAFVPKDVTIECGASTSPADCGGFAQLLSDGSGSIELCRAWINEIYFDDLSSDNEFVEVGGRAGTDLTDYALVYYEGSGRRYGGIQHLSGTLPDEDGRGYGAVAIYPKSHTGVGLRNGPGDGVALVHFPTHQVIQFLSYGGSVSALNGPAAGLTSTDLGLAASRPASQTSLQLIGQGVHWGQFRWTTSSSATSGRLNSEQALSSGAGDVTYSDKVQEGEPTDRVRQAILRSWTGRDGCGRIVTAQQTISVEDRTAPRIVSSPAGPVAVDWIGCAQCVPDLRSKISVADDCSGAFVLEQEPLPGTPIPAGTSVSVAVTARDEFGNTSDAVRVSLETPGASLSARVTAEGPTTFCLGGSVTLRSSPADQYLWNTGETGESIRVSRPGDYSVTVTDARGCGVTSEPLRVELLEIPAVRWASLPVVCAGAAPFVLNGGEPAGGTYAGPGVTGGLFDPALAGPGSHVLSYCFTNESGCSGTAVQSVLVSDPLMVSIDATAPVRCHGGADGNLVATAQGGAPPYQFRWETEPAQSGATAVNLPAGNYRVLVTDGVGCSATASVQITEPEEFTVGLRVSSDIRCHGGADGVVAATAQGGAPPYVFQWEMDPAQKGPVAAGLKAGVCRVLATDALGCTAAAGLSLAEPAELRLGVAVKGPSEVGASDGEAAVTAGGGTPPYQATLDGGPVSWSGNEVVCTNLVAGMHSVELEDALGCFVHQQVELLATNRPPPFVSISDSTVTEGDLGFAEALFRVSLSRPSAVPVMVGFATKDGTASESIDYLGTRGTLVFLPAGEPDAPAPAAPCLAFQARVGDLEFRWTDPSGAFELQASGSLALTQRWTRVEEPLLLDKTETTARMRTAGSERFFRLALRPASAAGMTNQTIIVPVVGDQIVEVDETFYVRLTEATGASIGRDQAIGTIQDDDGPLQPGCDLVDVSVSQSPPAEPVQLGKEVTFSLRLSRSGECPAFGVVVLDQLPIGMRFVRAETPQGWSSETNNVVRMELGRVDATLLELRIYAVAASPGAATNLVEVQASGADQNPLNNRSAVVVEVQGAAARE